MRPGGRQKWTWRFTDSDPRCLSRARRLSDHDLHIETNGLHQVHQPLKRKPAQPVLPKCQQAGLRDAERLGSGGPRESARFECLVQSVGEAQPGPTPVGVRESEVGEHVVGSVRNRRGRFVLRLAMVVRGRSPASYRS